MTAHVLTSTRPRFSSFEGAAFRLWASSLFENLGWGNMVPNKKNIKCERCGSNALLEVVPDGFDDAPASFTITRTCSGHCPKAYGPVTAQEMHDKTGLPLNGWSS
ncbi:MAG: hypothetical protein ABL996_07770 [Micropepsaceae bacterium]